MKKFVNFLKENWTFVAFVVMFIASVVLIRRSELLAQHIIFWVTFALCYDTIAWTEDSDDRKHNTAWLTTGIYLLAISVIWYLPIAIWWSLIPIFVTSLIHCDLQDMDNAALGFLISVFVTFVAYCFMNSNIYMLEKQESITNTPSEPVVITYVEKTSKDNIKVFIEGKGIHTVDHNDKTVDAQKLKTGDSVQIVVYQDKISKLIY